MEARLPRGTSAGRRRGPHPPVRPPGPVASRDQPARAVVNSRCEGCARAPILRAELMSNRNWYRDCGNISNKSMDGGSSSWVCAFMTAASARRESPFPAAHGTRPSKRSTQSCLTTLTSRNSRPPMLARLPLSPCRPVPFARADSWSSRAVPPRCVSGEIAPSRDADSPLGPAVSPAPAAVPPTPGRLARERPRKRHRRACEELEPPERTRSPRRGRPPSTVSVARGRADKRGFFVVLFSPVRCGKKHWSHPSGPGPTRAAMRAKSVSRFPPKVTCACVRRGPVSDPSLTRPAVALPLALPSLSPRR